MLPSKFFKRKEFACRCGCGASTVDAELLTVLDDLRLWCKAPVLVNSGHRCSKHNANVGGKPNSYHLKGMAADVHCASKTTDEIYRYLTSKYEGKFGIGRYSRQGFVHVDVRPTGLWRQASN